MVENKTKATKVDVDAFIEAVADPVQREDARTIAAMMARLSGEPARMWGPSIIGFGQYQYRYESGREGESCRIGFSPRKGQTVLYLIGNPPDREAQLARLGRHKTGKSCLYVKRLSDVDVEVLESLCRDTLAWMAIEYPQA